MSKNINLNLTLLELAYEDSKNVFVSNSLLQEYLNLAEESPESKKYYYKKAITVAKEHLRIFPEDKNKYLIFVDLGFACFCIGNLGLAKKYFKEALKIIPKHDKSMKNNLLSNLKKLNTY